MLNSLKIHEEILYLRVITIQTIVIICNIDSFVLINVSYTHTKQSKVMRKMLMICSFISNRIIVSNIITTIFNDWKITFGLVTDTYFSFRKKRRLCHFIEKNVK